MFLGFREPGGLRSIGIRYWFDTSDAITSLVQVCFPSRPHRTEAMQEKEKILQGSSWPIQLQGKLCDGWLRLVTMKGREGREAFVSGFLHHLSDLPPLTCVLCVWQQLPGPLQLKAQHNRYAKGHCLLPPPISMQSSQMVTGLKVKS
ncbi:hypothetical protein P7K49_014196 [Saguinus oedipus]|uniref:Uncharacterized protein n=1 Tax=Saguinus oedipus TaxID=9490 RepID=A0ABQ9VI31_SAGOE|nr:hypothetical protein P7K49_014196 [Saguinus oedipus]